MKRQCTGQLSDCALLLLCAVDTGLHRPVANRICRYHQDMTVRVVNMRGEVKG